jgi:hypothetical protein
VTVRNFPQRRTGRPNLSAVILAVYARTRAPLSWPFGPAKSREIFRRAERHAGRGAADIRAVGAPFVARPIGKVKRFESSSRLRPVQ